MYDLQKILLDNYCKKYNIEISKKETSREGVLFYYTKMKWNAEYREMQYDGYITAQLLFPEKFGLEANPETGNWNQYSN